MEQRKFLRLDGMGMKIDISDQVGFNTGIVKDVSRFGVCVAGMPRKLYPKNHLVTAIVTNKDKSFRLQIRPQWEAQEGLSVTTGAIIDDVPREWLTMLMQMEARHARGSMASTTVMLQGAERMKRLQKRIAAAKRVPDSSM